MFNRKKQLFLGLLLMSLVLVFTSGCQQKAKVYDLDLNTTGEMSEELDILDEALEEELDEEDIVEDEVIVLKEEVIEEINIVFEDLNWKKYTNSLLAYSVDYPTIVNIVGSDLGQLVNFTGPLSNNEFWPRISITHRSNDFYRVGVDAILADSVAVFPDFELSEEVSIADLETLHYRQAKTPQTWAADYYYFIKDGQLYNITILHGNDKEDWDIYNKFLDSFAFADLEETEE
jgi:hypothetical protein